MTNLFLKYELSVIAKEKGFDETCIAYYDIEDDNKLKPIPMSEEINSFDANNNSLMVSAPTIQQILYWLISKHKIYVQILPYAKNFRQEWVFDLIRLDIKKFENPNEGYNPYIECENVFCDDYYKITDFAIEQSFKLIK